MNAYAAALRALAAQRLTELQLRRKLERKGHADDEISSAVARCKGEGFVDDRLFAQLYVERKQKAVGDARLVAELVRKGIDRDAAAIAVSNGSSDESSRVEAALAKIVRTKPRAGYGSLARALERLGFPASRIYTALRSYAATACHPE